MGFEFSKLCFNFFPVLCPLKDSILFLHDGYALIFEMFLRTVIQPLTSYFFYVAVYSKVMSAHLCEDALQRE